MEKGSLRMLPSQTSEITQPDLSWPIFVISLTDQIERRNEIVRQMKSFGLAYEFIDAIDGRSDFDSGLEVKIDRKSVCNGRRLTNPEFGCALSHFMIYERIIDKNLPGAIILEDDAVLHADFVVFIKNSYYLKADLMQLHYFTARVWKFPSLHLSDGIRGCRLVRNAASTAGYSISRYAAKFFIENGLPIRKTADWPVDVTRLGALAVHPKLVTTSDPFFESSSIQASRLQAERVPDVRINIRRYLPENIKRLLRRARSILIDVVSIRLE